MQSVDKVEDDDEAPNDVNEEESESVSVSLAKVSLLKLMQFFESYDNSEIYVNKLKSV